VTRLRLEIALAYAGICLIWGTTWLAIKIGLQDAPPVTSVGARFVLAGLVLYAVAALRRELVPWPQLPWKLVTVYAVCLFGVNYVFTYISEIGLTSGLTAVLFAVMPFCTFILRAAIYREPTPPVVWIGTALAFAGVAIISIDGSTHGSLPYALAALTAATLSAYANVYGKTRHDVAPLTVLPPAMLISGIVVFAAGIIAERPQLGVFLVPSSLIAFLYLSLFGSAIAFFLNQWLLQRIDVSALNLAPLIFPLVALVAGAVALHEFVHPVAGIGIALIVAATWFTLSRVGSTQGDLAAGEPGVETS
jgi:drug/metabolite transporter (DMT)-like permease